VTAPARIRTALRAPGARASCPGCGAVLPHHDGPTHAVVGASPACWRLYTRLSSDPFSRGPHTRLRRLVVAAYVAQHPGTPHRRSIQSVAVHLMALCVLLEPERGDAPPAAAPEARRGSALRWLAPPDFAGTVTAADVLAAGPGDEHAGAAEAWARSVWSAWAPHQGTVRAWLESPPRPG
jgi:hypothetical protein